MVVAKSTKKDRKKSKTSRSCRVCGYTSERSFNVLRHETRIHSVERFIKCCGSTFATKGEYYVHAESIHPEKRRSWKIVTTKYKLTSTKNKKIAKLSCSSGASSTSASSSTTNSVETSRKQRRNPTTRKPKNEVKFLIKGRANADAISEYLGDIDFDRFRISVCRVRCSD